MPLISDIHSSTHPWCVEKNTSQEFLQLAVQVIIKFFLRQYAINFIDICFLHM